MLVGFLIGALFTSLSLARPRNEAFFPADLRIALADPLTDGRTIAEAPKIKGKGKFNRAAVSRMFSLLLYDLSTLTTDILWA